MRRAWYVQFEAFQKTVRADGIDNLAAVASRKGPGAFLDKSWVQSAKPTSMKALN